ncbi:DUF6221 family protein [Streptomyces turgidiscabies]|uniref:DUF6221 family protein n=1 Tax=Streptomyces turgidiscabies TaxID=85558 RepID=UPI0038F7C566
MTVDLVQWLTAQLDADERIARAVPLDLGHSWSDPGPWVMAGNGGGGREAEVAKAAEGLEMPLAEHVAHHIAAHDPARVLREVDSKRQLLARHGPSDMGSFVLGDDEDDDSPACRTCGDLTVQFPCWTLRLIAAVYADRDGYQEAWRP